MNDPKLDEIINKIGEEGFEYLKNSIAQSVQQECATIMQSCGFNGTGANFQNASNAQNPAFSQNPTAQAGANFQANNNSGGLLNSIFGGNFGDNYGRNELIKGILIGAGVTYALTNENAQKAIFGGIAKLQGMLGAGLEEMRERFEDAKAELDEE